MILRRAASVGAACLLVLRAPGDEPVSPAELEAARAAPVEVRVTPDRADRLYAPGAPASFRLAVLSDGRPLAGATIRYAVGPENRPAEEKAVLADAGGVVVAGGTLAEPGFIRCVAKVEVNGRSYRGVATVGFAPERIVPTQGEPADFDAFWDQGRADLARVPPDPRLELLPEASTGAINVYHVSFGNWSRTSGTRGRIYGILCEPKAPGRYPAVLRLPPAGVRPYRGERELAARGAITLEIGIHGIPVNGPKEIYDQLRAGSLEGYAQFNLDDPSRYFYRRVNLGCLRAVDFLASRANWDGRNLLVFGASQGGMLAVATAALDSRVTGVAAMIPAYCDTTGYLHGRAGGWPHLFRPTERGAAPPEKIRTTGYYDTVNFARRLRGPVLFAVGYNDENCPPTSVYAAYNVVPSPKELFVDLDAGHTITPGMDARVRAWLAQQAGLASER
ncbi:MAG TPA: acetylxylan esterase [Opitutaceae bacterium]|nr:acetylxylan esterase [Opitutaceae bacterium]